MSRARSAVLLPSLLLALAACGDAPPSQDAPPDGRDAGIGAEPTQDSPAMTGESARPVSPDPQVLCDTIRNTLRCARAVEEAALQETDRVRRQGDTLLVRLSDDTLRLIDRPGEGSDVIHFSFQAHWPDRGFYLIHQQYYEGSAHLLVNDATGQRTTIPDRPLRGPDGQRFAVLSFDLEAGYNPNTLQIWRFDGDAPAMEWETNPDTWGPVDGRWLGPRSLEFTRACPPGGREGTECGGRAVVSSTGEDWVLEVSGDT